MNVLDNEKLLHSSLSHLVGSICLVTGGTGFIGGHLVRRLSAVRDIEIRVLAGRVDDPRIPKVAGVKAVAGRLLHSDALKKAVEGADYIFHLAGLTRAKSDQEFQDVNGRGTGELARLALLHAPGLRNFCYMSSLAAVGPARGGCPLDESAPRQPITSYGRSKSAGESAIEELPNLPAIILRPPAVYGPGEQDLFQLFRLASRGLAPRVGLRTRHYSFLNVDDLVNAAIASAVNQASGQRSYFVAPPGSETGLSFIEAIERALGRSAWKPPIPSPLLLLPAIGGSLLTPFLSRPPLLNLDRWRDLTQTNWVCDARSLANEVGYTCSVTLDEGVQRTVEWGRAQNLLPPA